MKLDLNQTNFSVGEIGTRLYGRTDTEQYSNAVAEVTNMLVRPFGSLISCPGTELIGETKFSNTTVSTLLVRLIDFTFSRTDAFIIELGTSYFRFFTNGAVVEA